MVKRCIPILCLLAVWIATPAAAQVSLFAEPPLIDAIRSDDLDAVRSELTRGASPRMTGAAGASALAVAVDVARPGIVEALLAAGANPNAADAVGDTPLHNAARLDRPGVVELLVEYGADLDDANRQGVTPLMAAARHNSTFAAIALLAAGADVAATDFTGRTAADWARVSRATQTLRAIEGR